MMNNDVLDKYTAVKKVKHYNHGVLQEHYNGCYMHIKEYTLIPGELAEFHGRRSFEGDRVATALGRLSYSFKERGLPWDLMYNDLEKNKIPTELDTETNKSEISNGEGK